MAVNKIDPKVIFASEAPAQDTPAVFTNRTVGWGETRKNGGRPTIKQMNAEQQSTDLKILWLNENAVTPYDPTIDYPTNAVTIKDGLFKIFNGSVWEVFLDKTDIGLGNVDNTSDLNKPVSTATQAVLDLKADKSYVDNSLPHNNLIDRNSVGAHEAVAILNANGETQQQINDHGGATWYAKSGGYGLNDRVILSNGDIVRSADANNTVDPNSDMTGWEYADNQITYASKYNLKNDPLLDQSVQLQAIVDKAKSKSKILIIDSVSTAVYAVMNVDITGLTVEVSPSVSFIAPTTATNQYTFVAAGTLGNLADKTTIKNAKLDAVNRMRGVFKAEYVNDPLAYNCSAKNVPTGVSPDGSGVIMKECIRPRVKGGYYHGGRQGVLFTSCTNPVAEDIKTEHQGRDGILFYTDPAGTTTTDAESINCNATDFCINGEAGRAGIHFYGVRRAKATTPTASNDNNQTHDDTAAVRFRDCEDYYTDGYDAENVRTGVLANEVGDYASAPHNIVVRGAIGAGNIKNTRKFGVCAATPTRVCSIVGAVVTNSGQITGGGGIYSAADGGITGCSVDGTTEASGIYSAGKNTITGNTLKNAGKSGTSIAQITVGSESVVSGNTFENSDAKSALAIRAIGVSKVTIGSNSYDAATSQQFVIDATATLKRGGALLRTQFAGLPSITGLFENGVQICDTNGVIYNRDSGAWKRQTERSVSASIGTAQTTVAHGLGYIPTVISILVKSNANVWQSAVADITNIYLTSSVAATSVDISFR